MKPAVLFLSPANSVRSQMAEAILRSLAREAFEVCCTGTSPTRVSLLAVQVMNQAGHNITGQRAKRFHEFTGMPEIRFVIDLCDETRPVCPSTWPHLKQRLQWAIDDPEEPELETLNERVWLYRRCRDTLLSRIKSWLKEPGVMEALEQPVTIENKAPADDGSEA